MRIIKDNKNLKNRIIAISAGGTGGHIFPALSIAKQLINNGYYVLFFTDHKFFKFIKDDDMLFTCGMFEIVELSAHNAPRYKQIFMIIKDLITCRKILTRKVKLCLGFGGLVSFAPVLFSVLTLKKTIIHEQNAVIGLANKLLIPFVDKCLLSFQETRGIYKIFQKKCIFTGNPIRDEIKKLVYNYDNPSVNYKAFYKIEDNINLTITGGSQACKVFDELIPQAICMLPNEITNKLHITHQCKAINIDMLENIYTQNHISHDVSSFFHNIGEIFRASHLVISRAGSTSISELSALGVPSILIPLPNVSNDHQFYNAKYLRDNNATILLEQKSLTAETLSQLLLNLFNHDTLLFELSQCCRKLANINADINILRIINTELGNGNIDMNGDGGMSLQNIKYINDNVGLG